MRGIFGRFGLVGTAVLLGPAAAPAQTPPAGGPFLPYQTPAFYPNNIYNRSVQPLSPYLNLFRGSNPAVNYFYGVRPGLPSGGYAPVNSIQNIPTRSVLPSLLPATPPGGIREPGGFEYASTPKETTLSPAGHPVQFATSGGYSPALAAPRPGGFTRPQTPTRKP